MRFLGNKELSYIVVEPVEGVDDVKWRRDEGIAAPQAME